MARPCKKSGRGSGIGAVRERKDYRRVDRSPSWGFGRIRADARIPAVRSTNRLLLPKLTGKFDTLRASLKQAEKAPFIGVTQGGSSRTRGAKVAATTAEAKPQKRKKL